MRPAMQSGMRSGLLALPLLIASPACSPARDYQEAARSLRFSLERVEPSLRLALPLEQSSVILHLILGVENPSTIPFHLTGFDGAFRLDTGGQVQPLGRMELERALDLPAGGNASLAVALTFTYQDLAGRWPDLQAALRAERPGAWELEGTLRGTVHGFPVSLPVRTRRPFGAAP